ncbi:protein of unknown function (DUF4806) [Popillia japonica]|uniref:3-hydroxy-3-methylglutaryl coenzyme A reductase n=1 Tax=Popillia japonica TaxID=7064 RepID=A0AAW1IAN3_POPJA
MKKLPLQKQEDVAFVEAMVQAEPEFKSYLILYCSRIGGCKTDEITKLILKKLFSDNVAALYSWLGAKQKRIFSHLTLAEIILYSVRANNKNATDKDITDSIKNWLRHAATRQKNHTHRNLSLIIKCLYFETIDNKLGIRQKLSSTNEVGIQVNCLDLTEITCSSTKCIKTIDECVSIYKKELDVDRLTNNEIIQLVLNKHISMYQLENVVRDSKRAVMIRRQVFGKEERYKNIFCSLPIDNFDYDKVFGTCCENVVGYIPIPLGIAGPIKINNHLYNIPMATTEGCLVASITRGCKAVSLYGVESKVIHDGMTRGPVVRFPSASRASVALKWLQNLSNFNLLKQKFDSTSRYAQLIKLKPCIAGRYLFIRFVATTGDAMGMNMLSKATETSLKYMQERFLDMELLSLSGNFCTDKKPAYINWIEGRGKSVISEAIVPSTTITSVLKTTVSAIVDVNISKNLIGSSLAGAVGGNNAHAANVVTAIFLATGQDPAQNVVSSNCITLVEPWGPKGEDLYISCTMPSLEVGTVGGGTILSAQGACLDMLGIKGELSLLAALSAGHVVKSHLKLNRSKSAMK